MFSGELVSLFRCKVCQTSVFEKDAPGHLHRHQTRGDVEEVPGWRACFTKTRTKVYAQAGLIFRIVAQEQSRMRMRPPMIHRAS